MNTLNKKLIVVALAAVPLTAFGLSDLSSEVPTDFTMLASFESGVALNVDKTSVLGFTHPDIEFRLASNTINAATLTLAMTNAGYALNGADPGSNDGKLLNLKIACDTVNVFGVYDGDANVSAAASYSGAEYTQTALLATQDVLIGTANPVVLDDDVNGASPNYKCSFELGDNESLDELYAGNYTSTITLSWEDTAGVTDEDPDANPS